MSHASALVAVNSSDIKQAVAEAMAPFEEGHWFEDGSRWDYFLIGGRFDDYHIPGNVIQVKNIHPNQFMERRRQQAEETWAQMQNEPRNLWPIIFDKPSDSTLESVLAIKTSHWFPAHYAFLHGGKWHERDRMGWFGCTAKTECEIKALENGEPVPHRCKSKAAHAPEAYIVSWGDDEATWNFKFYDRFIKPLDPETTLVTVDYHV